MREAYWIWIALSAVAFGFALYLLLRPQASGLGNSYTWILVALSLLYPPVGTHFLFGQSQLFILLILVAAMRAMTRGSDWAAGAMVAAATLLRAFPLLLIGYFIVRRRWRTLACTAVALAVGGGLTIAMVGPPAFGFIEIMRYGTRRAALDMSNNIALSAVVSRLFWWSRISFSGIDTEFARNAIVLASEATILILTVRATLSSAREDRTWSAFCLWIVAAVMLSPIVWPHYLVLLLIPYSQIAIGAYTGAASRRSQCMMLASYFSIAFAGEAGILLALSTEPLATLLKAAAFISLLFAYIGTYWFAIDCGADGGVRHRDAAAGYLSFIARCPP